MRSRIRILKTFSSEIKSHRRFYLSNQSCYGISVFYNLLWFCFIIVTVRVIFKFIHLERFRQWRWGLGEFSRHWQIKVTTAQWEDLDRGIDSLETETAELFAQLSGKESSLHLPVFAFSHTAGGRAPALSFFLCLTGLQCFAHSLMVHDDFHLFWNTFC